MNAALIQNDNLFTPQYVYEMLRNSVPSWRIDNIIPFSFQITGAANNLADQTKSTRSIYVGFVTLSAGSQAFTSTLDNWDGVNVMSVGADGSGTPAHQSDHVTGFIQFSDYNLAEGVMLSFVGWKADMQVNVGIPEAGDVFDLLFAEAYEDITDFSVINTNAISGVFSQSTEEITSIQGQDVIIQITLNRKTYSDGDILSDYDFIMDNGSVAVNNAIDNGTTYTVELIITPVGNDHLYIYEKGNEINRKWSTTGVALDVCLEAESFIYIDKNYSEVETGAVVSESFLLNDVTPAIFIARADDGRIFPIADNSVPRSIVGIFTSNECI